MIFYPQPITFLNLPAGFALRHAKAPVYWELINPPVAIEEIEKHIIEIAFDKGFVKARKPNVRTGKKVAVVGSGPAGLAAAAQLNYAGHLVTVFESDDAARWFVTVWYSRF